VLACASLVTTNPLGTSVDDVEVKLQRMICILLILAEAKMNSPSKKPGNPAMAFVTAMATHDGLTKTMDPGAKAMGNLQYPEQFCWAAHKRLVPALNCIAGSQDTKIADWAKLTRQRCIIPSFVLMPSGLGLSDAMVQDMMMSMVTLPETMTSNYMLTAVQC
jgi:hypothetical protein